VSEIKLRPVVVSFAEQMEKKLRENDHKGGWDDEPVGWLLRRLGQEVTELRRAMKRLAATRHATYDQRGSAKLAAHRKEVVRESADVANFAMMIADVLGALKPDPMEKA
jgi:NTP pyrophosphatase (non-canonical NTP hydrolase)